MKNSNFTVPNVGSSWMVLRWIIGWSGYVANVPRINLMFCTVSVDVSCDSKQAHELLTEGQVYEVEKIHVGGWCSSIRLKEFPGKEFNTVHFIRYE